MEFATFTAFFVRFFNRMIFPRILNQEDRISRNHYIMKEIVFVSFLMHIDHSSLW